MAHSFRIRDWKLELNLHLGAKEIQGKKKKTHNFQACSSTDFEKLDSKLFLMKVTILGELFMANHLDNVYS